METEWKQKIPDNDGVYWAEDDGIIFCALLETVDGLRQAVKTGSGMIFLARVIEHWWWHEIALPIPRRT